MASTMVDLYSKELDEVRPHTLEHANRLFAYKHNHGWELQDTKFELNEDGIIIRRSTGTAKEPKKPGTTEHSGTA